MICEIYSSNYGINEYYVAFSKNIFLRHNELLFIIIYYDENLETVFVCVCYVCVCHEKCLHTHNTTGP